MPHLPLAEGTTVQGTWNIAASPESNADTPVSLHNVASPPAEQVHKNSCITRFFSVSNKVRHTEDTVIMDTNEFHKYKAVGK